MYLISNRDLEVLINAVDVMEYRKEESTRVHNTKRLAKIAARKLRNRMQKENKQR